MNLRMKIIMNGVPVWVLVAAMFCVGSLHAQVLSAPTPSTPTLDVTQFGVPADAKYVFCSSAECPERSLKHLAPPPPAPSSPPSSPVKAPFPPVARTQAPIEVVVSGQTTTALMAPPDVPKSSQVTQAPSPALSPKPAARRIKRVVRPKPRVDVECKPPSNK